METPSTKVTTFTLAAAVAAIVAWAVETWAHVHIPDGIQMALAIVVGAILAYWVPETNPASSARRHLHQ